MSQLDFLQNIFAKFFACLAYASVRTHSILNFKYCRLHVRYVQKAFGRDGWNTVVQYRYDYYSTSRIVQVL